MFRNLYIVIYLLQNLKNIFYSIFNLFFSLYLKIYNILYNLVINKGKVKCYFKSIKVLIYIRTIHLAYIIHIMQVLTDVDFQDFKINISLWKEILKIQNFVFILPLYIKTYV